MSNERDNRNTGVLFRNKEKKDKQPDYTGTFTDSNGVEFKISAWVNESKKGEKYLSMRFQEKEERAAVKTPTPEKDSQDDLPF